MQRAGEALLALVRGLCWVAATPNQRSHYRCFGDDNRVFQVLKTAGSKRRILMVPDAPGFAIATGPAQGLVLTPQFAVRACVMRLFALRPVLAAADLSTIFTR